MYKFLVATSIVGLSVVGAVELGDEEFQDSGLACPDVRVHRSFQKIQMPMLKVNGVRVETLGKKDYQIHTVVDFRDCATLADSIDN